LKQFVFGAIITVVCCPPSLAQTEPTAYFVPGEGIEQPKIVFQTGLVAPVIGTYDSLPSPCPTGSFWINSNVAVESCTGLQKFKFVTGEIPQSFPYEKALALEPIPQPGTDKPPPMKYEPPADEKVSP
jgi:hypothetical protein